MKKFAKIVSIASTAASFFGLAVNQVSAATSTYSSNDAAATGFAALFTGGTMIFSLCCIGLMWLLWAGLAYWVYKDAQKHNVDNAVLWAILTFFFGLIPLVIYLAAIRNKK